MTLYTQAVSSGTLGWLASAATAATIALLNLQNADSSGEILIQVAESVPEASTWATMILGFAGALATNTVGYP
jgi:hypothetical protein